MHLLQRSVRRALERVDEPTYSLEIQHANVEHRKPMKAVRSFEDYLPADRTFNPNRREPYRREAPSRWPLESQPPTT